MRDTFLVLFGPPPPPPCEKQCFIKQKSTGMTSIAIIISSSNTSRENFDKENLYKSKLYISLTVKSGKNVKALVKLCNVLPGLRPPTLVVARKHRLASV